MTRVACTILMLGLAAAAGADESTPRKAPPARCEAPPTAVVRELERLFKSAAEHATHSNVCVDGSGERTTIELVESCVERATPDLQVSARYRVTVAAERGGECSPYPDCAKSPPPHVSTQSYRAAFAGSAEGVRLIVPPSLPGVPLKTPLPRAHSTGCYGDSPAFVPHPIKLDGAH